MENGRRKVLVCGVTGFLGRNIAERLAEREDIDVSGVYHLRPSFDNDCIRMIQADLRVDSDVRRVLEGQEVVIQMAATTSGSKDIVSKPYIHVTDNIVMNALIFRAAYEIGVSQVIFPSCSIMYSSSENPLKESDYDPRVGPPKVYVGAGRMKVYLEQMCEFFSQLGKTKFTAFRHSNVYGPHDKFDLEKSHVFGATITKVMTASDKVVVWGTGEEGRDLLYVSDVVDFVERTLEQKTLFELVNIGAGKNVAIRDLVQKIVHASGKNLKIEYDTSKPSIKTSLCLDYTLAEQKFGWKPLISLDEGIQKTLSWYRENILRRA